MFIAETKEQRALVRWLDEHAHQLRPAQVTAVGPAALRLTGRDGTVSLLEYNGGEVRFTEVSEPA